MTERTEPEPGLRPFFLSLFVPSAIFGLGTGAGAPMMALLARELGASVPVAGLIVALVAFGAVLGDLPSGTVVARFGERRAIVLGSALGVTGVLVSLSAPPPAVLAVGATLTGFANAEWGLARQSYLAGALPLHMRARGISANAAMSRADVFVGPYIGAAAVHLMGVSGGLVVQLVAIVVSGTLVANAAVPEPDRSEQRSGGVITPVRQLAHPEPGEPERAKVTAGGGRRPHRGCVSGPGSHRGAGVAERPGRCCAPRRCSTAAARSLAVPHDGRGKKPQVLGVARCGRSSTPSPRLLLFAEMDVPAHHRVVFAQHESIGVVAAVLASDVGEAGTGGRTSFHDRTDLVGGHLQFHSSCMQAGHDGVDAVAVDGLDVFRRDGQGDAAPERGHVVGLALDVRIPAPVGVNVRIDTAFPNPGCVR